MARKTAPANLPLEERPEFLAEVANLPAAAEVDALRRLAAGALAMFNDAIRGNSLEQVELARLRSQAVVYRMNGDVFRGCNADSGANTLLLAALAATPGKVPCWGQDGEWFLEVNGMRMWARARNWMRDMVSLDFHPVDVDQPFISDTGYLSHFLQPVHWLGYEFGAAVRAELERCMERKDRKPRPIKDEYRARRSVLPAWLLPALEGVTSNGQHSLPLSGRAPIELPAPPAAAPKVPKSNAERQRDFRKRQREQRELEKAGGVLTVTLSSMDRSTLSLGLLAHEDLNHRGPNWVNDKKPQFDELLAKLWPGGSNLLEEPQRSTYRPSAYLRDELERCRKQIQRMDEVLRDERNEVVALRKENERMRAALEQISGELTGAVVPAPASAPVRLAEDLEAKLRAEIAHLERWNSQEIADRAKAYEAVEVLQARLKKAGLNSDYRRQPGE